MTSHEAKLQTDRLEAYHRLETRLSEIREALSVMDTSFGQHKCSAFTGNTRESRRVVSLSLAFSPTSGGEPGVELRVDRLHISAWKLGDILRGMLDEQQKAILSEMEKL